MKHGYTLIEVLMVISIVAVLTVAGWGLFGQVQKFGRDATRKSDLLQYQIGLEKYYSDADNLQWPDCGGSCGSGGVGVDVKDVSVGLCGSSNYMSNCPSSPAPGTYSYFSTTNGTAYVLYVALEINNQYFIICANGKTGYKDVSGGSAWTPSATCPL